MTDGTISTAHIVRRAGGVAALAAVALVHILDASSKFSETPYLGWAYVVLIAGCLVAAVGIGARNDHRAWALGGVLCAGALLMYSLSRSVGLPAATDDIGNWLEPIGEIAVLSELTVALLAAWALLASGAFSRARPTA